MLIEPTLEHYIYYLRRVEGDNRKTTHERRAAFGGELRALLAHLERLSGQIVPVWEWPQESEDLRVSQRIMRTDWLDRPNTGYSCFIEARTYGDVYWLQIGYSQQGQAEPEIFADLRDEAWQPTATEHLLGSSCYLCGIVAGEAGTLAARVLEAYTGNTPPMIVSTYLADGYGGLHGSPDRYPHTTVLLYPNARCEAEVGRTILNNIALRFELYKHKADRQLAWCEQNLPILLEQEQMLRELLEQASQVPLSDALVNVELLRRLIRLYRVFNGNVGMLVERDLTIETNLENLNSVFKELRPLAEDHLLGAALDRLRGRRQQLKTNLAFADQARQQADATVDALRTELALDRLLDSQMRSGDNAPIERAGWPGMPPLVEPELTPLTASSPTPPPPMIPGVFQLVGRSLRSVAMRLTASRLVTYPQITPLLDVSLKPSEKDLLRHVYRGFGKVFVERELGGGYSGTRVFLTLPVSPNEAGGLRAARRVTKIGPAFELRRERDSYARYVRGYLPFCVAQVEEDRYFEHGSQAGLNYLFAGGGTLGQTLSLEECYRRAASSQDVTQVVRVLDSLLNEGLGQTWYCQGGPLTCPFALEYGQHLVEHLRLRLRPGVSSDTLSPPGRLSRASHRYKRIEVNAIPSVYAAIQPGRKLVIEGLVIKRIKRNRVKLQDSNGRGIIIGVEFPSGSNAVQGLEVGSSISVRGEVVYNRRARLEEIVCAAFPDLSGRVDDGSIELSEVSRSYPNPLQVCPRLLNKMLEGRRSCVHGDLHLRNVLVDEWGRGWLIDFGRVEQRHNLFDFIKLETYVRLMGLAGDAVSFSLFDYAQFEEALNGATLGKTVTPPQDPHLPFAYQVILAIRNIAQNYTDGANFPKEYLPALFLYCLAVTKYYRADKPLPTRLAFVTACELCRCIRDGDNQPHPAWSDRFSTPMLKIQRGTR
jgi:hypothetical protein